MWHTETVKFPMMSEQKPGQIPGDVIVKLSAKPDKTFKRIGDNLHTELTLTLKEALLGFTKTITQLDGRSVELKQDGDPPIKPGQKARVKGEGMPKHNFPSEKGDMIVTYKVKMPDSLTAEQRAGLAALL